jgi:hypothetical protein
MQIRLGQDLCMGIGKEASWAARPTMFKPLTVLQQSLAQIPMRRHRQELGRGQFATKSQLIHSHIGGDISWQMAFGHGDDLLASGINSDWRSQNISGLVNSLPRGTRLSWLVPDTVPDTPPPSFSLLQRFDKRDAWQHFQGLKVSRLRLTISAGGEVVMGATMIGKDMAHATRPISALANHMPDVTASPAFNLNLAPSSVAIEPLDGASRTLQSTGDFALSHLAISVSRGGMAPLFGLSAMPPIGIANGVLAIHGQLQLLYTPSLASVLRENQRLKIQLSVYDGSGHVLVILLPDSLVTNSDIETSSPAMPTMLKIQFESRHISKSPSSPPLIALGMAELDAG